MGTRLATTLDLAAISALRTEMKGEPISSSSIETQLETIVAGHSQDIMLVTDDADTPVGMAIVSLILKLPKIECRIDEVIVSASQQGKGLGTVLMNACEDWAWQHRADSIEFTSRPSREAANHLYQKLGYELRETNVYTKKRTN